MQASDRNTAAIGTVLIHGIGLLLIIMMMRNCSTPEGGGGGGTGGDGLMALDIAAIGNPEDGWGEAAASEATPVAESVDDASAITETGSELSTPEVNPNKPTTQQTVVKPTNTTTTTTQTTQPNKPKPNPLLGALGQGNTTGNGQQGTQNGSINGRGILNGGGSAGTGGGTGGGNGTGNGPGNGGGSGLGTSYNLAGRKQTTQPKLSESFTEEGRVVVKITVDKNGNVISAEPDPVNSNTSSSKLYALAKKAALTAKFDAKPGGVGNQFGSITINFKLH